MGSDAPMRVEYRVSGDGPVLCVALQLKRVGGGVSLYLNNVQVLHFYPDGQVLRIIDLPESVGIFRDEKTGKLKIGN